MKTKKPMGRPATVNTKMKALYLTQELFDILASKENGSKYMRNLILRDNNLPEEK